MKKSYTYILSNQYNTTIYVGVTSNLARRIGEHRSGTLGGFTAKYKVKKLVYYETFIDMMQAIEREKQIKSWKRIKKVKLIESVNPNWSDLMPEEE